MIWFPIRHIHVLKCNSIDGVDFGRRDVNIANKMYGYSKGAAMKDSNIYVKV